MDRLAVDHHWFYFFGRAADRTTWSANSRGRIGMIVALLVCVFGGRLVSAEGLPIEHAMADSDGIKIHYVIQGSGPLVVMIHGFPDYWYTWRRQMPRLAEKHRVVAIDQRGYNRSDKPANVEDYAMPKLVGDVAAVIKHTGNDKAIIVGHDWGGAVAWMFASEHPEMTERLIVLNTPHPQGLARELATNPKQQQASAYARRFQQRDAAQAWTPEQLAFWVSEPQAKARYLEAFRSSSIEGMLNYYKANYPRPPYTVAADKMPNIKCPTLLIFGLKDRALLPEGLNGTWNWIDNTLTLVTIPSAGHFVQHDAAEQVTRIIVRWLDTPF